MRQVDEQLATLTRLARVYALCVERRRVLPVGARSLGWGLLGASQVAEQFAIRAIRQQPAAPDASQVAGAWVAAVFSHNERRAHQFANTNQIPHVHVNLSDLLERRDIHCIYVSSHPRHRFPLMMAALTAGKHVLCETPLALTLDEAKSLAFAAANRSLHLAVNYVARANPAIVLMRALLAGDAIGDVIGGRISNTTSLPLQLQTWRLQPNGGGVIYDRTTHTLDLLRYLLQDEIGGIYAASTQQILSEVTPGPVPEDLLAQVQMARSGVTVQCHDSFLIGHNPTSVELYGTRGALLAHHWFHDQTESTLHWRRHDQIEQMDLPLLDPFWHMIYQFNAAVRTNAAPLATAHDGLQALAIALAGQRSLQEKVPVSGWRSILTG
jgi:1,5-anhydro-D-fructose reductase (1,5-anhydro-D-mannitol-forming)